MAKTLFIQLSRLGDNLQTTPLLAAWKERHPGDVIAVLTRPAYTSVFEGNDDVDEVLVHSPRLDLIRDNARSPIERLHAAREWVESMRSRQFDTVVNLTHDWLSSWLVRVLGAPRTRGVTVGSSGRLQALDAWSVYLFSLLKYRNLNLFNLCDIYAHLSGGESTRNSLRFSQDAACRRQVQAWLGSETGCVIGFQPGASTVERRWPKENFIALGRQLRESAGARILVFGGEGERALAEPIAAAIPGAESFAGRTTFQQLGALLERCRLLVTNDTGTMHLASAVGTRIVALFEASAYLRETGPYGEGHWILQSRELKEHDERTEDELKKLGRIPVHQVRSAVQSVLSEKGSGESPPAIQECAGVDQFRSVWHSGHVDYRPVVRRPLDPVTFWAYLQKPVWLSTLDDHDLSPGQAAVEALEFLRRYFLSPETFEPAGEIGEGLSALSGLTDRLRQMRDLIQTNLNRLSRNRRHLIPQKQITRLTDLEAQILTQDSPLAIRPFVACLDTGLAMVTGDDTASYLENYRHHVMQLWRQTRLLTAVLQSAQKNL